MSLLSDPDFLIHSLRLNYLRNVEDPYGQRLISFSPFYSSNPYVAAAHLSDIDRWPELHSPSSPHISEDEADNEQSSRPRRRSGFPGATGLKYSATIMPGNRQSGLGMSVRGRRPDVGGKRMSRISAKRASMGSTPSSPTVIPASENTPEPTGVNNITSASPLETAQKEVDVAPPPPPPPQPPVVPGFVPKFKGAAEMDARRRLRLQARQGVAAAASAPPKVVPPPSWDSSSSEGESTPEFEEDGFDDVGEDGDLDIDGDDGDEEFDPEFVNMLGVTDDSVDGLSSVSMSNSGSISMSNPSHLAAPSSLAASMRGRSKLSPVREKHGHDFSFVDGSSNTNTESGSASTTGGEPMFEMVTPPPKPTDATTTPVRPPKSRRPSQPPAPDDLFIRQKIVPPPKKSALSMRLSEGTDLNPFSELYSAISGRGATAQTSVTVFFPQSNTPTKPMNLSVRKDSIMEEVLGFALWTYWEEKWEPRLDESEEEERLSAVGWVMRIAEEDGEVDEDFPPPDRMGKISKFNFDAYAVLAASATQMQQNKIFEAKIQRSPSRVVKAKRPDPTPLLGVPALSSNMSSISGGPSTSAAIPSTFPSHPGSVFGSFNPSSSFGPQIFLRIRVQDTLDAVHVYSTIHVTSTMYLQEALDIVCHRRKLPAKDYTFLVSDMSVLVALDRTVASLQGKTDLLLVKKEMVPNLGVNVAKPAGSSADPNSSIFVSKSNSNHQPEPTVSSMPDFTADYKRYTVYRKMPMLVGRHERILAIDGAYIHFMPSNKAKAVFESGKTSSHHIKSVVAAQQSDKSSSTFRIVVHRLRENGGNKRYDFEAESSSAAAEIVQTVKSMKNSLDRQSTIKARRSKHMG
ncbi:hypothetical protein PENSPDRAFT_603472 [Peniophora sp. CONT]|nr:hypothetical protein PENSPDRAFT_603472 [Peniophora sp. CONT]